MNFESFGLRQDPFPIVPDGPVHNWAGRTELRDDLVDLILGVRGTDIGVTEFAVLHGEYGAGKSHALRYLKTLIDEDDEAKFNSVAIYLERPRVANKLNFLELHKYIIRSLGRDTVKQFCLEVKEKTDQTIEELASEAGYGNVTDKSSFIQSAIKSLPSHDRNMVRLLRRGAEDGTQVYSFLLGETGCGGDEYEGKIDSDFIAANVLSDLFRVIASEIRPKERIRKSVYLFIDEFEMLVEAKAAESELVFSGLRELINSLPYRFGLFISFTGAAALIEAIMPQHLLKRMTVPYIEIPALEGSDAKDFLLSQLKYYRLEDSEYNEPYYPFEEDAVDYIIENAEAHTPRNLFKDCKRVIERALRRHGLQPGDTITREVTQKILVGYR